MSLSAGNRLGPYEIVSLVGAGGMGEVYKAFDTRLDRTVAIKVLPAAFTGDAQFRERFDREARIISQLDHPHICALYDVGEATVSERPVRFLVIQYLEGTTLADRIARGPLPLKEALSIATQIADALDSAHRAGIVHRDLKPGNVMLTRSGAKLLDFGLATARGVASGTGLSMMPTTPPNLTAQGTILGTFQYMAPEQLEGKEADSRADLFAFGAVLYEMITGRKAFSGASHASLISSIMSSHPPPVSTVMTLAPAALDQLIARCLAKDPEERWQSARDVKLQLAWIADSPASSSATVERRPARERVAWTLAAVTLVALLASIAALWAGRHAAAPAAEAVQFTVLPPDKATFSPDPTAQAVSPDGRQIAFVASSGDGVPMLWIRRLDSLNARVLAGSEGALEPFWSPDSGSVGFFAAGKLKRIDASSGPPQTIADAPFPLGGSWGAGGVIVFGGAFGSPLFQVPAAGGAVKPVTVIEQAQGARVHNSPWFLPDGRHFFFVVGTGPAAANLYVGSIDSTDTSLLLHGNTAAVYAPPGYILFRRESTLVAQAFDLTTLSVRGEAVVVADRVGALFAAITFPVSNTGTLVYRPPANALTRLTWVDRAGRTLGTIQSPAGIYEEIALSPDDKRVAFSRPGQGDTDVWLTDLERGITSRFTFQPSFNNVPIWSPDGRRIVFASGRDNGIDLYQRASDGSSKDQLLLKLAAQPLVFPSDWSADGRFITYYRTDPKTQLDIWTVPTDGERKPVPYLHGDFNESQPQFSPDGRWMAYVSDESGISQVYVQSFPTLGGQRQISADGGVQPRWRRDGQELFYVAADRKLMAVTVKSGTVFESDKPHALFQTALNVAELRQSFAVSADGQRFLVNAPIETESPSLTVVLNWTALLKK
jgi:Tol biopolymer transport system component